jgi:3-hydroxy-9,10-secoandrosta-1,3,5(10)-triene-9,17-dione monooxygenase reductase component
MTDFDLTAPDAGQEGNSSRPSPFAPTAGQQVIAPEHYRATLGHFCSGVTIVTGAVDNGPAGFTCQSFSALSLVPPLILVCPAKSSTSWPKIEAAGSFCVNILAEDQEEVGRGFAMRGSDKFVGIGWTPGPMTGAPVITGSLAWIECELEATHDAGDHVVAFGRVLDMSSQEGRPLLFFRGGYGRFDV